MSPDLQTAHWLVADLGSAMEQVARRTGLAPGSAHAPPSNGIAVDDSQLSAWIQATASWLGIEAEPAYTPYDEIERLLAFAGPALLRVPNRGHNRFLVLLRGSRKHVGVLAPDGNELQIPIKLLRDHLCSDIEAQFTPEINRLLDNVGVPENRRSKAQAALLREQLRTQQVGRCWLLRSSPAASSWLQARQQHLPRYLRLLMGAHALEYMLLLVSWWLIGRAALNGRLDYGWLLAWALLLLTMIPFRLSSTWLFGVLSIYGGALLKQRLLHGALRLRPEETRHKGIGQFLCQVIESEAVESLALSAGFQGVTAAVELVAAAVVLWFGAGGSLLMMLLLAWLSVTLALAWRYFQRRQQWTNARLHMTADLTERMMGHRTRLVQELREDWHDGEDKLLEHYLEVSQHLDHAAAVLNAIVPRGWLLMGLLGLVVSFTTAQNSAARLAISLGGILLAYRSLHNVTVGLASLAEATLAWQQVDDLFHAAERPQVVGLPAFALAPVAERSDHGALVEAHDLSFRYGQRGEPVLQGCTVAIRHGERLLLEGPSGGGKSTFASLLIGMREPQSGLLLLGGLDRQTVGEQAWRRHVVSAPQFHENHVLTESFAFNLLMGRRWPPSSEDLQEAEMVCQELGLDELLQHMPAGLMQMVGETGWQLSHGERSRMFIARALLQGADLIILDESFAALDPETLRRCLECVLKRAPTLMVIAHP
jgi:ATP-binding cassette subfamily B protein